MIVYTENKIAITLADESFSEGGEGKIFKVTSAPQQFNGTCVKIYFDKYRTPKKASKIGYMAQNPPSQIKGKGFLIGWPLAVIVDSHRAFLGFVMYLAPHDSIQLVNLTATKLSKKLGEEWHQYYDRENGKFSLVSRLKLIHNIAIPIHLLHSTGKYVLTDFKPQNVLVTRNGIVTLVDLDSIQITEGNRLQFSFEVLTPMYMPTEYYTKGIGKDSSKALDKSWDCFSIGVVFYQLIFGLHPYVVTPKSIKDDSSSEITDNIARNLFPFGSNKNSIESYPPLHNKFSVLPQEIQTLFKRAFSPNPSERPNAEEWGKAIHQVIKNAGSVSPPPPVVRHRVRFLAPDGKVLREIYVNHGQCLYKQQIPVLPVVNGTSCTSWDMNPENDVVYIDKDYHAIVSPSSNDQLVRCPECGQFSDSIKSYSLPYRYWFLGVYISTQNVEYTCCPHCMRKHILIHGFTYNILTFNVLWPWFIFPWMVVQLIRSYTQGHSKSVYKSINNKLS